MEREKRINWLSLLIKVIIIFVIILIIIWIVSKIVGQDLSDSFKKNINSMESSAINYFKTTDLPLEKGKSIKITLEELLEKNLISSDRQEELKKCNIKDSNAKITREKNNYLVEVTLECGKEEDTISSKFSFENCRNCGQNNKNDDKDNTDNSNSSNNSSENQNTESNSNNGSSDNSSNSAATTYYEYVKDNVSYSKWMKGNKTGTDIENKYEYYSIANKTYYTLGSFTKQDISKNKVLSYTIKLNEVPNKKYYFMIVKDFSNFQNDDINKYLGNESEMVGGNNTENLTSKELSTYALEKDNFTYKVSPYYRKGSFYVDIEINIKNKNSIKYNADGIAFIPIKLNIEFASNEILTDKPTSGEYVTITYYRYIERTRETVWSDKTELEGYTKTGNTKIK